MRTVARSLERLASLAERGAREPRQTRPPRSVLELAPEAAAIRELAMLLRAHPQPLVGGLAACDRFVFHAWNAALRGLDHELLRRELGRARFALATDQPSVTLRPLAAAVRTASMVRAWPSASASPRRGACSPATAPAKSSSSQPYGFAAGISKCSRAPSSGEELDAGGDAVPGVAHTQDAARADGLQLAAIRQIERAVEMGEDVVLVRHVARQATVDAGSGVTSCWAVTLRGSPASIRAALTQ